MTPQILSNIQSSAQNPTDLDGYEDLKPEDKEKVNKAWEEGKVAEADIPESAKKLQGDDEKADDDTTTKGKKASAQKAAAPDGEDRPKRARSSKKVGSICSSLPSWMLMTCCRKKPAEEEAERKFRGKACIVPYFQSRRYGLNLSSAGGCGG